MASSHTPVPDTMPETVDVARAIQAEQVRLHVAQVPSAMAGAAMMALILVAVQWDAVGRPALQAWLVCVALAICARAWLWFTYRRTPPGRIENSVWRRRFRISLVVHGVAWGLTSLLLFPSHDVVHQSFLAFMLCGLTAVSLTLTAFDLAVALVFCVTTLVPLASRFFIEGEQTQSVMGMMVLLFLGLLTMVGRRTYRDVRGNVLLRRIEAAKSETLRCSQEQLQRTSELLREKTRTLEVTLNSMSQGIVKLDADGRVVLYNSHLLELLELSESSLDDQAMFDQAMDFQPEPGARDENFRLVGAVAHGYTAGDVKDSTDYLRKTRSGRTLRVRTQPLPDGGMVRTYADVTSFLETQRALNESEAQSRKLALAVAHIDNAVFIADASGLIEWVNPGFVRITGYSLEEVAGRRLGDLLRGPDTDPAALARIEEHLQRGERVSAEILNYARDGRSYWAIIEIDAIRGETGEVTHFIAIDRDITESKKVEAALYAAKDAAEAASRAKSEFLASMSHELRTPLNAILGFSQLFGMDARLPQDARDNAQEIEHAGQHLLSLVNDLIDLARVEAGKLELSLEPVPLESVVTEGLALVAPIARKQDIELVDEGGDGRAATVHADYVRLRQVVINLLSNAIKYNRPRGKVRISCRRREGVVRIGITDTGLGIPADMQDRIFNAFDRLGAERGQVEGTGIGLVITKRIVEAMGGAIGFESVPGQGSTFWVEFAVTAAIELPVLASAAPAPGPETGSEAVSRQVVLYVEDNPMNLRLMQQIFNHRNDLALRDAHTAELGLELARADPPALILMDINLPGMDGYTALSVLKADPRTARIPVIAVTANAMQGDRERGLKAGFVDYIAKPIQVQSFLVLIDRLLGSTSR